MPNKSFTKDFGWYFLGSFLPLVIGFIKTPIFTRHFSKEDYGYLGLVTVTFSYLGMLLFSWIGSCIWRYYNKYQNQNNLKKLYTNLFFLLAVSSVILLIVCSVWYYLSGSLVIKQLVLYSFLQLIFNQLFLCYMVVVRLQKKSNYYTIFHFIRSLVALVLALVFVFIYDKGIIALVSSLAIVDFLVVLFLILFNPAKVTLDTQLIARNSQKEMLRYGAAGLIINLGFLIITSSDRYIIAWLTNLENVGVYDQVYKISQFSIAALVTVFFNTINPVLLNKLESEFKQSNKLIKKYMQLMLIYGLPIVIYLSLFSKDIANILLGKEFRIGYTMMPYVFIAAYLHGILNFYELRLKFSNKLKRLSSIIITAAIINLIFTYVFVYFFGYEFAALTTTFTYVLLVFIFHSFDREMLFIQKVDVKNLAKISVVLIVQIVMYLLLNYNISLNLFTKILLALLFAISYFLIFKKELLKVLAINEINYEEN